MSEMMPDREKVIKGLEHCKNGDCVGCPYDQIREESLHGKRETWQLVCNEQLTEDILSVLMVEELSKEQKAKEGHEGINMGNKTYRDMAVEVINIACKDLMDRAESLIPDTDGITGIDIVMHIPSITDDSDIIPTIRIKTDAYVTRVAAEQIIKLVHDL